MLAYFVVKDEQAGLCQYAKKPCWNWAAWATRPSSTPTTMSCVEAYGEEMKVGRVIANSPSSQGAIGDIYNTNTPSLTLGLRFLRTQLHHLQCLLRQPHQQKAHRKEEGQYAVV